MKSILTFLILIFTISAFSQSWSYNSGDNTFDGRYRIGKVIGISDNNVYTDPIFIVNYFENSKTFNIYLGKVGYFCDNVKVKIIFDNDSTVFYATTSPSNKQEVVFLDNFYFYEQDSRKVLRVLNIFQFLELIKKHNKMIIRLEDDCDINNLGFSLTGSSKAINYVYGNQAERVEKDLNEIKLKENFNSGPAIIQLSTNSKYITLWDSPGVNGNIIARVTETDTVQVIGNNNGYFQIQINDSITGWCNSKFVSPLF